jgi:DNA repair ATPase RecN
VPVLNTRINYWLQFLIDNQVTLNFNSELEETIESNPPDGDPFVYNALSGGEHNRIDLAISQAFAYLMMLSAGTCPSVVVLDEVATNVDRPGVHCLYSMISELARDRQVVVITHDPDLQAMLQGADRLAVEKRDGFTVLAP